MSPYRVHKSTVYRRPTVPVRNPQPRHARAALEEGRSTARALGLVLATLLILGVGVVVFAVAMHAGVGWQTSLACVAVYAFVVWIVVMAQRIPRRERAMSRTVKVADGDLVQQLSDAQQATFRGPRGAQPAPGTVVTLWRLGGTWSVWSAGPESGTWWLRAHDDEATRLVRTITEKPARAYPVVVRTWRDCIAVKAREIRPAGAR